MSYKPNIIRHDGQDMVEMTLIEKAELERLQAAVDKLLQACGMGHSALDQMMGDSDLPDDDSYEMKACQALIEAIRACENLSSHSVTEDDTQ